MSVTPPKLSGLRRIAVFRALPGLGDLLCVIPALRALRHAQPDARITFIGLPQAAFLLDRFPRYVDELLDFPGWPGLVERQPDLSALPAFFSKLQERRFDLLLQMHGSGLVTNPLVMLMGAARTAGFYLPGQYCPDETGFLPYPAQEPEPRRHLRLMESLGMPAQGEHLEFPLHDADHEALHRLPQAAELARNAYVCIHPGASIAARRWPVERFARVADTLAERGLRVVLTGSAAERELTGAVAAAMRHPVLDLCGQTSLGAMAALLAGARLLVCNDTGVSHLAAALGVPSVVIFIATGPARWAPLDRRRHRVVGEADIRVDSGAAACRTELRCLRDGCPTSQALTLQTLREATVEAALRQAEDLLREDRAHAAC